VSSEFRELAGLKEKSRFSGFTVFFFTFAEPFLGCLG
jgi:hypothetical protein